MRQLLLAAFFLCIVLTPSEVRVMSCTMSPGTVYYPDLQYCGAPLTNDDYTKMKKHAEEDDSSWHLLTKSFGGTISFIKGLTKAECVAAVDHIDDNEHHTTSYDAGSIKWSRCFQ